MIVVVCVEPAALGAASRTALALARQLAPAEVIALSAGGPRSARGVTEAMALGATRAVRIADGALELADYPAIGQVLALAVRRLDAGLVLAGARSDDEGRGVVPAALAERMRAPLLCRASDVRLDGGALTATVRAGGWRVRLAADLPAVVTVLAVGEQSVEEAPAPAAIETLSLADLALDPATLLRRPGLAGGLERPKRRVPTVKSAAELVRRWLAE